MAEKLKIGIVGLGLIGGSIERKLTQFTDKYELLCVSKSQNKAYKLEDLADADVVFLCSPQSKIPQELKAIAKIISDSGNEGTVPENERAFAKTIITDAASTKKQISQIANELSLQNFIPGHPMAGTEKQGYENSFAEIFQDATWVLAENNNLLESIIKDLGAKLVIMDVETHDKSVAIISHLPLLVSLGLASLVTRLPQVKKIMGPGIKGMLRLSQGNTEMSKEIISINRTNIKNSWELLKADIDGLLEMQGDELAFELESLRT